MSPPDSLHKHTFCLYICIYIYSIFLPQHTHTAAAAVAHFCDGSILKQSAVRNSFMVTLPKTCLLSLEAGAFRRNGAKQEHSWAGKHTHTRIESVPTWCRFLYTPTWTHNSYIHILNTHTPIFFHISAHIYKQRTCATYHHKNVVNGQRRKCCVKLYIPVSQTAALFSLYTFFSVSLGVWIKLCEIKYGYFLSLLPKLLLFTNCAVVENVAYIRCNISIRINITQKTQIKVPLLPLGVINVQHSQTSFWNLFHSLNKIQIKKNFWISAWVTYMAG